MSALLRAALLSGVVVATACGPKGPINAGPGTPVTIQVLDEAGSPITTADVRNPEEEERHSVNAVTGAWTGSTLYLEGGQELVLEPGMEVSFEISAPGYLSETVRYILRKRKNVIVVTLSEMNVKDDLDKVEDPMISFGRDKPLDGQPAD